MSKPQLYIPRFYACGEPALSWRVWVWCRFVYFFVWGINARDVRRQALETTFWIRLCFISRVLRFMLTSRIDSSVTHVPPASEHSCSPPQLFGSLPLPTGTRPLPHCLRWDSGMFYFICPSVLTWPDSQMFGFQQLNVWMLTPWVPISSSSGSLLMKTFSCLRGEEPSLEMLVYSTI